MYLFGVEYGERALIREEKERKKEKRINSLPFTRIYVNKQSTCGINC